MNPKKRMLNTARRRAKIKGLEFNIEEDDLVIPEYCPYLNIKMKSTSSRGESKKTVLSLDRIDPAKGYIKGNVEVISWQANTMKSDASREELLQFAKVILEKFG